MEEDDLAVFDREAHSCCTAGICQGSNNGTNRFSANGIAHDCDPFFKFTVLVPSQRHDERADQQHQPQIQLPIVRQQAIYGDRFLTEKDRRVVELQNAILARQRQTMAAAQHTWLDERNRCTGPNRLETLKGAYDARIQELEEALAKVQQKDA